ncbi:MAG TPA: hypothetical protein VFW38_07590 [Solirubrobacteraceae bacterium]|nr:hypothetical protein [Solirubrobacteraceae bacterium]
MSPRAEGIRGLLLHSKMGVTLIASAVCALLTVSLMFTTTARAGTYPMYQCSAAMPSVSPGWTVFGNNTLADTVLSNSCSSGGSIGVYVFTNEQGGVVTENGHSGSQIGLQIAVPGSVPGVTIHSIKAEVLASSVTGDDAFLGFASAGQTLPGGVELPYGGSTPYTTSESWTLPQGSRDFEAYVNCSTDRSSTSCAFADANAVPALSDVTLSLEDDTPPRVASVSGPLVTAAASGASVMGSQAISFTGSDTESGVRAATLTLSPLNGGAPYVHTFNFSGECAYDSWNACALTQTVSGFAVNTDALANGAYSVSLAITDAAGNVTNDALGSLAVNNPGASLLGAPPGPGAGSPNGVGASEGAHLQLGVRSPISRRYGKRAVRVSGRLLNAQGLPIAGATLNVLQQTGGAPLELVGRARTGSNGTFIAVVAAGPSRTIEIAYRAFSADSGYAATARLHESVRAGVRLMVSPRRTGSEGTITLSGRVFGPVPPQGVVVELLVHYRGRWEPFRDPRTDGRGRFRVAYQFQGGVGRFPFRALVFGNQSGFPFALGESRTVDVTTN